MLLLFSSGSAMKQSEIQSHSVGSYALLRHVAGLFQLITLTELVKMLVLALHIDFIEC